ncbi:MAG TPA: VIT domain-containing protein [Thermoanaerobaculia bacterium]|nr:VIT domain-containing protein [Thermoanaerobaculia bacterium]
MAAALLLTVVAFADGMIVIPTPVPVRDPFPLAVKYHHVTVSIHDQIAKTSIDQEFFNPSNARLEGMYIFPLPKGAVIRDFSMEVDGKMLSAELLDAVKARGIYEDIVRKMRDPALLEYIGNGAFKVRIFPIEPRSTKRVKLSYSEALTSDAGLFRYTYPLNTEKFSAAPLDDVSIRVDLESQHGLKTIFCPSHDVEVRRKGARNAVIGFEAKRTKPDTDFTLYFSADDQGVGLNATCHRVAGEPGYFLLAITPAYDTGKRAQPKDITFVLDVSGSMAGEKIAQAKRALKFCLANLNADDRFDVIRFSTEADALFGRLEDASAENVKKAREYVDGLRAIGGTNSEEALTLALKTNRAESSRPKVVIFITDGKPTVGETDEDRLVKRVTDANVEHLRIFTFGVGDDLNTHFLDKLTEATHAARTYVSEKEDLELPVSSFYEKIKSPVLVDISLEFDRGLGVTKVYPRDLPDLFKGNQLTVFGRYGGTGSHVTLRGKVEGKSISIPYLVPFPAREDDNELIAPLWAAQRIGYLLDQIRLHGQEKELVDEVTELARKYGIVTPYTSYLIMEDEKVRVRREDQVFNVMPPAPVAAMKSAYDAMNAPAGAASVQASKEVEAMKNAQNLAQANQGRQQVNAASRNVQGRAVYNIGNSWIDSKVQSQRQQQNVRRVQFASPAWFDLLHKEPNAAQFLALGKNVRFALNDAEVVDVFE